MKWIHVDFWFDKNLNFRREAFLTKKEKIEFEDFLREFILKIKKYINRKFYLYEDIPHCFLAIELKNIFMIVNIEKVIKTIKKPDFFYRCQINTKAGNDAGNGEGFLDILNAMTDFYLFKRDNKITHIIHCCMEFMTHSRQAECKFYQNMAVLYQVIKVKNKKLVYGFKRFTPELRKNLKTYISSLDLRKK